MPLPKFVYCYPTRKSFTNYLTITALLAHARVGEVIDQTFCSRCRDWLALAAPMTIVDERRAVVLHVGLQFHCARYCQERRIVCFANSSAPHLQAESEERFNCIKRTSRLAMPYAPAQVLHQCLELETLWVVEQREQSLECRFDMPEAY